MLCLSNEETQASHPRGGVALPSSSARGFGRLAGVRDKAMTLASLTRQTGELIFAWQLMGLLNSGFSEGS